ncbi:MAG TPA: hypothetical protein VD791_03085 [Burkholderiales bacterium]|nr:hypothetical protein [Burkholderiales bacterium]
MNKKKSSPSSRKQAAAKEASPPAATPSDAQRLAAAILEVLAGLRSPPQAAELLGVSLPRYYQLEARALEGLVAALAPRPKGKQPALENRVRQLEQELEAARRACARQEALVRVTQRSLGLAALAKPPAKANPKANANGKADSQADAPAAGRRRKPRRPLVRALRAAQQLRTQADRAEQPQASDQTQDAGAGNSAPPAVQPIAPNGAGEETRP